MISTLHKIVLRKIKGETKVNVNNQIFSQIN